MNAKDIAEMVQQIPPHAYDGAKGFLEKLEASDGGKVMRGAVEIGSAMNLMGDVMQRHGVPRRIVENMAVMFGIGLQRIAAATGVDFDAIVGATLEHDRIFDAEFEAAHPTPTGISPTNKKLN